jgi:hypothetical protein
VSDRRTAYHLICAALLATLGAPGFEVVFDRPLMVEPLRPDFLLLRRHRASTRGKVLQRLWPLLTRLTVIEYKSPGRPVRRGDVAKLLAYSALVQSKERCEARECTMVLLVARMTPNVDRELARSGWRRSSLGDGYYRIVGSAFSGFVVAANEVARAEKDELLALAAESNMTLASDASYRWFRANVLEGRRAREMQRLEGYDKVLEKALARLPVKARLRGLKPEERLSGLKPEQRLSGLKPEERLSGLAPDEQILALSNKVLRQLPREFVASLAPATRRRIHRRLKTH